MGVAKGPAVLLMKESVRRLFQGTVLTLGKQDITVSPYQLKRYSKMAGFSLPILPYFSDEYAPLQDRDFFSLLGFSNLLSLDYSNYEGASIPFDLNSGEVPEPYRDAFDVIYDGGTLEHIFHLPNALKSLIGMLKPGGRLIHLNPTSNHVEHSFYMFSPTFFYDYYTSNKFEVNYIQLVRYTPSQDYQWTIYDYTPGRLDHTDIGSGRLDAGMYAVHTVVTKTAESTSSAIPNQGMYARDMWVQPRGSDVSDKLRRKWKQKFKMSLFYPMYAYFKLKFRKQGVPIPYTDRF